MTRVFLSYASEDDDFVMRLSNRLIDAGIRATTMKTELMPGESLLGRISKSLLEADAVVVIVSELSLNSKFVQKEIDLALGSFLELGRPLVIPVILDKVSLPFDLSNVLAIVSPERDVDLVAEQIVRAVHTFIGRTQAQAKERREIQQRVETNAADYIRKSLDQLKEQERQYRRLAYIWYGVALVSLLLGLGFGVWRAFKYPVAPSSWESVVQLLVVSLIVIGLSGALSRFAFVLGKSFMVESLRNSDRMHAISFGDFYLRAYGEHAERSEIKEAFQHWNIDKGSSFIQQTSKDIDPEILSAAIEIVKGLRGKR